MGFGAEIGVWKGEFSSFLLKNVRPKKLHLIDPWCFMKEYSWAWYGGVIAKSQVDMNMIYHKIQQQFGSYPQVEIHRMRSFEASHLFSDPYFDWIYIDGDHTYEGVMEDLCAYFPKVKAGGLIIGDDYGLESVTRAVQDFCSSQIIKRIRIKNNQYIIEK